MNLEQLEKSGFKEYPICSHDRHERHWSIQVKDEKGVRFFVVVRLWENSKYSTPENQVQDGFDAHTQFDMHGPRTFDVHLHYVNEMTPQEVIEWFDDMWKKLSCQYHKLWGE